MEKHRGEERRQRETGRDEVGGLGRGLAFLRACWGYTGSPLHIWISSITSLLHSDHHLLESFGRETEAGQETTGLTGYSRAGLG